MALISNIFHNRAEITARSLDPVKNNLKMASRVARRWDGDFQGSTKIGDTLNIRTPGFYAYRSGAGAAPGAYNDNYIPVTIAQGGADILLTSKELGLNIDDFMHNVVEPLVAPVWQKMDHSIVDNYIHLNQFAGTVGTAVTDLLPFLNVKAVMTTQSACHQDDRISGLLNAYQEAGMVNGLKALLNPSKEISDQYRLGSLGEAGGIDYFTSSNAPSFTLGVWSGTPVVVGGTPATDGGSTVTTQGWGSGVSALKVGECLTIQGVYAVNPQGKDLQAELKQFTIKTASNDSSGTMTLTLDPPMYLTGPLQNINALPVATAAIYMWGTSAATALAAGTGQIIKQSLVFHEDAMAFCMADVVDVNGFGGAQCKRVKDEQSGLRSRMLWWYNGQDDTCLLRFDVMYGSTMLRQGFGGRVIGL